MVPTIAHEDLVPSWLVVGCPLWLNGAINESDGKNDASSLSYISKPFLEQEFEPLRWHDILAALDVCANVHATRHTAMMRVMNSYP